MRWVFHYRMPFTRQLALLEALQAGCATTGDEVFGVKGFDRVMAKADGLILYGIGGISRGIYDAYRAAGKPIVFFDKGYSRGNSWLRVAANAFQPLPFVSSGRMPSDRFFALDRRLRAYKADGTHILFDGASNKFCLWQGLGDWVEWGAATVKRIRRFTDLPIIYRPRPSHNGGVAVPGAELSLGPLADDLARARVCVSYGGNIGWDCVLAGVPHFAIGDSVARPLSETDWIYIERPFVPTESDRLQWCANVAYSQFTFDEIRDGTAWRHIIRTQLAA